MRYEDKDRGRELVENKEEFEISDSLKSQWDVNSESIIIFWDASISSRTNH